jgi:hypothetical protein
VSIPQDGDSLNAASVEQAFKESADYGAWMMRRISALISGNYQKKDDFEKAAIDTDFWTLASTGGSSDPTQLADSAANGIGAVHPLTAGSGSSSIVSLGVQVGTNDFGFATRVRVASGGDYNLSTILSNNYVAVNGGGFRIMFATGATNWMPSIGGTDHNSGVAWGSIYQYLAMFRIGGTAYFFINNSLVYSVANTSDFGAAALTAKCTYGTTDGSMYNDTLALWVDR